jgi:hypothetical protein
VDQAGVEGEVFGKRCEPLESEVELGVGRADGVATGGIGIQEADAAENGRW